MNRRYRWKFHFNAMHNMTPEKDEGRHAHSFLVILCMEIETMDLEKQNTCEKVLKQYLEGYAGTYLNEQQRFAGALPTIEAIGEVLYEDISKIAKTYEMHLIQVEVGDNPTALFSIGNRLLIGGSYVPIPDETYQNYRKSMQM